MTGDIFFFPQYCSSCWYFHCPILYQMKHDTSHSMTKAVTVVSVWWPKMTEGYCLLWENLLGFPLPDTSLFWAQSRTCVWRLVNCSLIVIMTCRHKEGIALSYKVLEHSDRIFSAIFHVFIGRNACEKDFVISICLLLSLIFHFFVHNAWIKCHVRYIKSVPEEVSGIRHIIWMNS